MLNLMFRGPWYAKAIFALICVGLAFGFMAMNARTEAEKALAREAGMPVAVSLNDFDRKRDEHAYDEVNVTGWFNKDYNYELTEHRKRNFIPTGTTVRRMFVMFGPEDGLKSREVRAVVMLAPSEVDHFIFESTKTYRGLAPSGFLFDVNGRAKSTTSLSGMVDDALAEQGLTKAKNFRYIEPWNGERDTALKASTGSAANDIFYGLIAGAGVFFILALAGFKDRHNRAARMSARVAQSRATVELKSTIASQIAAPTEAIEPRASGAKPVAGGPKTHTPRWLWPLFLMVGVGAIAMKVGGGAATGMIMLAIFVYGLIQAKRAANRGLSAVFVKVTGRTAPITVDPVVIETKAARAPSAMEGVGASVQIPGVSVKSVGQRKYIPLALGLAVLFVGSTVFKTYDETAMTGYVGKMLGATSAPSTVDAATQIEVAALPMENVQMPEAKIAQQIGVTDVSAVNFEAQAPSPLSEAMTGLSAAPFSDAILQRPEWQLVAAGLFLLFISVGMVLVLPMTRRRGAVRNGADGADPWVRLDRIVERERALQRHSTALA